MKLLSYLTFAGLLIVSCTAPDEPKETYQTELIEIDVDKGTNMAAALSPDGETLAFDVLGRLWLMPAEGGEAVAITDSLGNARQPTWSPDGEQIAFQAYWEGNWHIYTINKDGSGLKRMTDLEYDHREPHWSPDGTTLVFSSDRNGTYDIWTRDVVRENMTSVTDGKGNEFAPAWSPDGSQMAYVSEEGRSGSLVITNQADNTKTNIYQTSGKLTGVSWSSAGDEVFFNELKDGKAVVKSIPLSGGTPKIVSDESEEAFPFRVSTIDDGIIYTADGEIKKSTSEGTSTVEFSTKAFIERGTYARKVRDFDSTEPQRVKGVLGPVISPDGSRVVFTALQDLWVRNSDGSVEQLTDDQYIQILPDWSPDGESIAYSSDKTGEFGIYQMNMSTKEESLLIETTGSTSGLRWSPDGKSIAYTMSFGPRGGQLFILDVETRETRPLGRPQPSSVGTPTWSPNGEMIALSVLHPYSTLYREGVNRVMLFSVKRSLVRRQMAPEHWSFGVRSNNGPVWSPDGKYMAAATKGTIWIMPVDEKGDSAGDPVEVTTELSDSPTWAADSKTILFAAIDQLKTVNIEDKTTTEIPLDLTYQRKVPTGSVVIHVGGLIDGKSEQIAENVDVTIEGNRIVSIDPHDDNRSGDQTIDASDAFLMPGLIDNHAHEGSTFGEALGRAWLSWGVTAMRNPSADPYDELNRKEAIISGQAIGPRIYLTGSPIDGSRIYYGGAIALQSEKQIDMELNRAKLLDYDLIKTYVRLSDPLQQRVVDGAHAIGIPVTSHELYPAVAYNTDGTEHVSGTSRIGYSSKISRLWKSYDDVTDLLAKSGMSFTPTTAIISYKYLIARDTSHMSDPRVKAFRGLGGNGIPGLIDPKVMALENTETLYKNLLQMVTDVHRKGGFVVAGTDSPIIPYGLALHIELATYQEAGLTPFEVLQTATVNNARLLNASDDLGSVEVGKLADLVIVEKNPLEDITNTRTVRMVIKNGEVFDMESLLNGVD